MEFKIKALSFGLVFSLLLASCSSSDDSGTSEVADDATGNLVTKQVPAIVLEADELKVDATGDYVRENVAMTLEAVSGNFSGYSDKRLKVASGTTLKVSLDNADAITQMRMRLLTTEAVESMDTLVSDTNKLTSISLPDVTSAGSRTLYFDEFEGSDTDVTLTFNQDVEIEEVQIKTNRHLAIREFTEDEVSVYAVLADDGKGSSITKTVYANLLTNGQSVAVDGRYPREKVKVSMQAVSGNFGGYVNRNLVIDANTSVNFSIDKEAEFYAMEFDFVSSEAISAVEELVAPSEGLILTLFDKPDQGVQRLSIRAAEDGVAVNSEITFLKTIELHGADFYSNSMTVGF